MTANLASVLSDVFVKNVEKRFETIEEERAAILAAKGGDSDALVAILYAYSYALSNAVAQFRHAGGASAGQSSSTSEEMHSAALFGVMEAIHKFDPAKHHRLAAVVNGELLDSLSTSIVGPVAITVPARSLKRFYHILRTAKGDVVAASALAPQHEMKVETFLNILAAVRTVEPDLNGTEDDADETFSRLEAAKPIWTVRDGHADAEDRILVESAFRAVDDLEEDVCRLAYGFADFDPVSDAEIGHRLGLSRPKTQRVRAGALVKMRSALGVA